MTLLTFFKKEPERPEPETCKGLIFRANTSSYLSTDDKDNVRIGFAVRLNKLKRKSCTGCSKCGFLLDDASERIGDPYSDYNIINLETAEHGQLYTLKATNFSRDWESGQIDDWDLELVKVDE